MKAAQSFIIPAQSQSWVSATSKRRDLVVLQPHSRLYERHPLTCTNGVATVEPYNPFRLLVANFPDTPKRIVRNQTVNTTMSHPSFIAPTPISTADVIVIVLEEPSTHTTGYSPYADVKARSVSWAGNSTPTAADIYLAHVPDA